MSWSQIPGSIKEEGKCGERGSLGIPAVQQEHSIFRCGVSLRMEKLMKPQEKRGGAVKTL
jgi:hypothetical protein